MMNNTWEDIATKDILLPAGHQIGKGELLFSKIEDTKYKHS